LVRTVGVNSVRRDHELPPCQRETVPEGSKTEKFLSKDNPFGGTGDASVIIDLRKGRKSCAATVRK